MAVMWPRELPTSIRHDRRRRAEVRAYDRLAHELEDAFTVFYSSPWLGIDRFGAEKDGECDFLVVHPRLGYLAIEVKGGGISYDPTRNEWKSKDAQGFRHIIKDPVDQARSAKYELLKKLKSSNRWTERFIKIAHGVVFPDAATPPSNLGADKPARIFCCSKEFAHGLRSWIGSRMYEGRTPANCQPLGPDGVAAFTHILAHPFQLHFTVSAAMTDAAEHLGILEPTQFHILDHIADIPRAEIRGGAGTGKTVIAAEEAMRSSKAGKRTLLVCHSAPLAAELNRRLDGTENLTVASFHSLCGTLAARAQIQIKGSGQNLFEEGLPSALIDAAAVLTAERWDMIVVDEGQDFHQNWWIALSSTMAQGCCVRVMSDSNQRVYAVGNVPSNDFELIPIRLTKNLRNTRLICDAAAVHYEGPEVTPLGPEGHAVSWIGVGHSDQLVGAAAAELRRLIHQEEVPPSDIAVLLPASSWLETFNRAAAKSNFDFAGCDDMRSPAIVVDTVRRFKGLERAAVILVVAPADFSTTELAYVGMTRPKTYLAVVSQLSDQRWLQKL
jgi:hypothetical protein